MARYNLITFDSPTAHPGSPVICDVNTAPSSSNEGRAASLDVRVDGEPRRIELLDPGPPMLFLLEGRPCEVVAEGPGEYRIVGSNVKVRVGTGAVKREAATTRGNGLVAPMPGRVVKVLCQLGDLVETGAPLVVLEAMKMENELVAPHGGRVTEVFVSEGNAVEAYAKLVALAEA